MGRPEFAHIILTTGDITVVSGGPTKELLRFFWTLPGGLALAFVASAFDNSPNIAKQFQAQISLLNNGVEFQQTLGFPPNNVLQSVGAPPASIAKHAAFSSLWVGILSQGDLITVTCSVTGDPGSILVNNLNTHVTLLVFPNL